MQDTPHPQEDATPRAVFYPDGLRLVVKGYSALKRAGRLRRRLIRLGCSVPRNADRSKVLIEVHGSVVIPLGLGIRNTRVTLPGQKVPGIFDSTVPTWQRRLPEIVEAMKDAGARISYFEIALDILNMNALEAARLLVPRLVLDGFSTAPVKKDRNTTYARRLRSERNLAWYIDKPHKLNPVAPVLHLDLRLKGGPEKLYRWGGLHTPSKLLQLTESHLAGIWESQVLLAEVDPYELEALTGTDADTIITYAHDHYQSGNWTVPMTAQAVAAMLRAEGYGEPVRGRTISNARAPASGQGDHPHTFFPLDLLGQSIPTFLEWETGSPCSALNRLAPPTRRTG